MDGDVLEINKTELNEEEEEDEKSSDSLEELSDAERLHSVTAAAHTHTRVVLKVSLQWAPQGWAPPI